MEKFRVPKKVATAFMPLGLLMAACGDSGPQIEYGVPAKVVRHEYDDKDVWVTFISTGKTLVPITHVDQEHFYLDVEQCGHEEFEKQNVDGCGILTVEVDQDTYGQFADGSTIIFNK